MAGVAGATFQQDILFAFGGGDFGITIAVLGGPVDRTHDCFRGARLTPLRAAAEPRGGESEATARATHIASLIFGQPCSSAEGVVPLCRGLLIPIVSEDRPRCTEPDVARAIMLAIDHGAHVITTSDSMLEVGRQPGPELAEAIARCAERNILIVTAADGRTGLRRGFAASAVMMSVGAIDKSGRAVADPACGSLPAPAIMVPGSKLIGAALEGGVAYRSGANYAAALVAGIAGLLLSSQLQDGQTPNPRAVGEAILASATPRVPAQPYECARALIGRDNIQAAVERVVVPVAGEREAARCRFGVWRGARAGSQARQAALRPRA